MRRVTLGAVCTLGLLAAGCVEGEQTYTINPDGSGKVRIDVVMAPPVQFQAGPAPGKKADDSLDGLRAGHLRSLLTSDRVDAWGDVSATYTPEGKLRFAATGYFKRLDDYANKGNASPFSPAVRVTRNPDGSLTLGQAKDEQGLDVGGLGGRGSRKTPAEYAKMADAELDEELLGARAQYQSVRGLMRGVLDDMRLKVTFVLPGEVSDVRGFATPAKNAVTYTFEGKRAFAAVDKVFTLDNPALRKLARTEGGVEGAMAEFSGLPAGGVSAKVGMPGKPLFDYDAEVKAARAAYPDLRKRLRLPAEFRLPGEPPPVPMKK